MSTGTQKQQTGSRTLSGGVDLGEIRRAMGQLDTDLRESDRLASSLSRAVKREAPRRASELELILMGRASLLSRTSDDADSRALGDAMWEAAAAASRSDAKSVDGRLTWAREANSVVSGALLSGAKATERDLERAAELVREAIRLFR